MAPVRPRRPLGAAPTLVSARVQESRPRNGRGKSLPAGPRRSHDLGNLVGLLLGMGILSVSLPVGEPGRPVPLWLDVIAAGVAVAAFSVFFSTPLRMLGWPVAIGMLAHAVRWGALKAGAGVATGALAACLLAGGILAPVARRWRMPFAAIGFASVVSMMSGVFLFRMASGLVQLANYSNANFDLLRATIADAMTAIAIILAMSFGGVVPKMIIDRFGGGLTPTRVVIC